MTPRAASEQLVAAVGDGDADSRGGGVGWEI
jgi:hypothetical protein